MLRKFTSIAAVMTVVASAACNSITAPQGDTTGGTRNSDPTRSPAQRDKVCVDELRAVEITSPSESQSVYGGQLVMVTWDAQHLCGGYTATVRVSYDGGQSFSTLGSAKNISSMGWRLPELDGVPVVVAVDLADAAGIIHDAVALRNPLTTIPPAPDRDPSQHD